LGVIPGVLPQVSRLGCLTPETIDDTAVGADNTVFPTIPRTGCGRVCGYFGGRPKGVLAVSNLEVVCRVIPIVVKVVVVPIIIEIAVKEYEISEFIEQCIEVVGGRIRAVVGGYGR